MHYTPPGMGARLAAVVYFLIVVPLGALYRLVGDPLQARRPVRGSNWVSLETPDPSLKRAQRMT